MSHNFAAVYLNAEENSPPKFVCMVNQVSCTIHYYSQSLKIFK